MIDDKTPDRRCCVVFVAVGSVTIQRMSLIHWWVHSFIIDCTVGSRKSIIPRKCRKLNCTSDRNRDFCNKIISVHGSQLSVP